MQISEIISGLIQFNKVERPVYVVLFTRDADGNVLSKQKYPIDGVFSYKDDEANIYIEQAHCESA